MAGDSSAYVLDPGATFSWAWKPKKMSRKAPIAASGAVNRPGKSAPAVNPITASVITWTAPTTTGHTGGPLQVAWSATWM